MNKIPSILVDTGFGVDQNGALNEIDTPNVVTTLDPPKKVVFSGTTLNWVPSTTTTLQEFSAPKCTLIPTNCFKGFTSLTTVIFPALTTLTCSVGVNGTTGAFYGCTGLTSVSLPALTTLTSAATDTNAKAGAFYGCTGLTSVSLPALTTLSSTAGGSNSSSGAFYGCTGLTTVSLPVLTRNSDTNTNAAIFGNCTSLESVQIGSEGHAVTALSSYFFKNCTQSGLTITIYTSGGAALSGSPWGATNATIVYEEA